MPLIPDKKLMMLRPAQISLSMQQPRKTFDPYDLKLLADSISASGILQPLAVRKIGNDAYELIAGERRLKAAVMAGLRRVPCVVHRADDETAALFSLLENLQRRDLSLFEEAAGLQRLITAYGLSQSEIAARLGLAQSTLSNKLRLLQLSEALQERIASSRLSERHARALLRLPEEERETALDTMLAEGLTPKQAEEFVSALLSPPKPEESEAEPPPEEPPEPVRKAAIGDLRLFSNSLSKLLQSLQNSGIQAHSHRSETDDYIEYRVQIPKSLPDPDPCRQLKIC